MTEFYNIFTGAYMEFGWINIFGGAVVLLVMLPNIAYFIKNRSENKTEDKGSRLLHIFEQVGRYGCMLFMLFPVSVKKTGFKSEEAFALYLILNAVFIALYYISFAVYIKKKSLLASFSAAALPAVIFLFCAVLLSNFPLILTAVIFGTAHLRITYLTHKRKTDCL